MFQELSSLYQQLGSAHQHLIIICIVEDHLEVLSLSAFISASAASSWLMSKWMFQELGSSLYMGKDAAGTPRCFTGSRLQRTFVAGIVFPNGESSLHLTCFISLISCVHSLYRFHINKHKSLIVLFDSRLVSFFCELGKQLLLRRTINWIHKGFNW